MVALKLFWEVPGWIFAPGVWAAPTAGVAAVVGPGVPVGLPKRPLGAPETAGVSAGFVAGGLPKRPPAGWAAEGVGGAPKRAPAGGVAEEAGGAPKRAPTGGVAEEEVGGALKRDCPIELLGAGAPVDGVGALLDAGV